jgi:hypothetical protein
MPIIVVKFHFHSTYFYSSLVPETQNLVIVDMICPNHDPDEYFSRKVFYPRDTDQYVSDQVWSEFVEIFQTCPHALSGKPVKVKSIGTNPYIYTDFDRNVFYDEKGLPVGSNSQILQNIGKVFGFEIEVNLTKNLASYYDNATQQWTGLNGEVRFF